MSRILTRSVCVILVLILCMIPALAEPQLLPDWELDTSPVTISAQLSLDAWSPLDDVRCGQLSALLRAHQLVLTLTGGSADLQVLVDGSTAFNLRTAQGSQWSTCSTSLLPGRLFTSAAEDQTALDVLMGAEKTDFGLPSPGLSGHSMPEDGVTLLENLQLQAAQLLQVRKQKNSVTSFGNTTLTKVLTMSKDQAAQFGSLLVSACPEGALKELLSGITFTGAQKVSMLTTDEGIVHKVTWEGSVTTAAGEKALKLVWKLNRSESQVHDDFRLDLGTGSGRTTWTFTRLRTGSASAVNEKSTFTLGANSVIDTLTWQFSRTAAQEGRFSLQGTISLTSTRKDAVKRQVAVEGQLAEQGLDGTVSIRYRELARGGALRDVTAVLTFSPAEALSLQPVASPTDLDGLAPDELSALRQEMVNEAAYQLVARWVLLPQEATLYISQDLPQEAWLNIGFAAYDLFDEEE